MVKRVVTRVFSKWLETCLILIIYEITWNFSVGFGDGGIPRVGGESNMFLRSLRTRVVCVCKNPTCVKSLFLALVLALFLWLRYHRAKVKSNNV